MKSSKRKKIFDKFFTEFWADVGDTVYFRNATRNKVEWRVEYIETDHTKCKWSKGGKRPNFIKLHRVTPDKRQVSTVWTCSDQLVNAGFKT